MRDFHRGSNLNSFPSKCKINLNYAVDWFYNKPNKNRQDKFRILEFRIKKENIKNEQQCFDKISF